MARKKTGTTGQYVPGMGTGPAVAAAMAQNPAKKSQRTGKDLVNIANWRYEHKENQFHWRFLLDSYEGGERYRNAVYGPDRKGMPVRNLRRHRREYPDPQQFPATQQAYGATMGMMDASPLLQSLGIGAFPGMLGADPHATAMDDDYEFRRAATPVPDMMAEVVDTHLSKLFKQEVDRVGPANLVEWWKDVDGRGTPMDDWMRKTGSRMLLVLGVLDVVFDHPRVPPGEKVKNRADEIRLGLDTCVMSYILPENMVWWKEDSAGRYTECLVQEFVDAGDRKDFDNNGKPILSGTDQAAIKQWATDYVRYRYWNSEESILYNSLGDTILEQIPHKFGRVPIVRGKAVERHRTPMVAKSFYDFIAIAQRAFYNKASELELSDTIQAFPLLSGPEDYCKADNTVTIGPHNVVPKKKNSESGNYEGWEYISPSKDPAASLRTNLMDHRDAIDRRAALTKPAGVQGTTGGTVGQSGISKQLDAVSGNDVLADIAKILAEFEKDIAEFALLVLNGEHPEKEDMEAIDITYPSTFELFSADEILAGAMQFQAFLSATGNAPITELEIASLAIRKLLPGLKDEDYKEMDKELEISIQSRSAVKEQETELHLTGIDSQMDILSGSGDQEKGGESDPMGVSAGTSVSGMTSAAV